MLRPLAEIEKDPFNVSSDIPEIFVLISGIRHIWKNRSQAEIDYIARAVDDCIAAYEAENSDDSYEGRFDRLDALDCYVAKHDFDWIDAEKFEDPSFYELCAVLVYEKINEVIDCFDDEIIDDTCGENFPLSRREWTLFLKGYAKEIALNAFWLLIYTKDDYFQTVLRRKEIIDMAAMQEIEKQAVREQARRAAKAKQSPYEKAGTIAAVFAWLDKNPRILEPRGGKADAIRKIQSMAANQEIPAPDIPTEKTAASWITQWEKQKSAC
ncbi:hypothetical protein ACG2K1_03485 [Neisseria sp. 23W00296]|uniref:hypothetical protein n=1 Tax=unclassified Neisseria TaxID=2623750 RepID=UPI0002A234DB|nr:MULTISPECIES: hypothetical protein [unclassified Neisseria]ASP17720.1 hypothetical protein CGZ77_08170 [Neisseria sp. KEM232]EKY08837.1 hypothetical protein HMPREF9120_00599 [Neisseria sp. oral taxon 020 str. F0370]